ncbi:MAG: Flp pilus assembly protein CpaB [Rhizobiales bacterium]|nr:Flp pilus assembly protein CpaB [Hyphomicrobiales bacterium]
MKRDNYPLKTVTRRPSFFKEKAIAMTISLVSAIAAALMAQDLMTKKQVVQRIVEAPAPAAAPSIQTTRVLVARSELNYGDRINTAVLQVVDWPSHSVPEGAYGNISQFFSEHRERVALTRIVPGEAVLGYKVTGPGRRAGMAAMLRDNMKAATIRVDESGNVGGFVRPGDTVDVLVTHVEKNVTDEGGKSKTEMTDVLLEGIRVLAADQVVDQGSSTPTLSRTITLEVTTRQAQKLALAAQIGTLSLVIRDPADVENTVHERVTTADFRGDVDAGGLLIPTAAVADPTPNQAPVTKAVGPVVSVVRVTTRESYEVPSEGARLTRAGGT